MTAAEELVQERLNKVLPREIRQGFEQGKREAFERVARMLLDKHEPIEKIVELTGLSSEEIKKLRKH